ncbi:hypothetical protein [Cellulomonas sp. HZM]|uniref:hypothetical protein n=1 Tax=Cellulomonas sp. HZM TaxID=1454010 RepID=UPI000492FFE3|nr:hypothetical protein [Cellulomonas sp. HZM]
MTHPMRATAAVSLALAAALAVLGVLAGASGASADEVPLRFSFTNLLPGDVRSSSQPYRLEQDARVEAAVVDASPGSGVAWRAALCGSSGSCVDLMTVREGDELAAGDYTLTVGVTADDIRPGEVSSLEGRITLVERTSGSLASTGSTVLPLAAGAVALGVLGLLLILVARRRDHDDETGQEPLA